MRKLVVFLRAAHDFVTRASFVLAGCSLCVFTLIMAIEVALRYFLNAPTTWAQDVIAISLCGSIFFAMPYITKLGQHSSIGIFTDKAGTRAKRRLRAFSFSLGFIVLLIVSWLSFSETIRQYTLGIQTASSIAIAKWPISLVISYGVFSSALYMLRSLFSKRTQE